MGTWSLLVSAHRLSMSIMSSPPFVVYVQGKHVPASSFNFTGLLGALWVNQVSILDFQIPSLHNTTEFGTRVNDSDSDSLAIRTPFLTYYLRFCHKVYWYIYSFCMEPLNLQTESASEMGPSVNARPSSAKKITTLNRKNDEMSNINASPHTEHTYSARLNTPPFCIDR
ncbi:hypothetical protein BDZ97DRAFT_836186 [Flammula alnicola]|nr:hypothetical protein BDZ97DRAFT_836186 [Flammula alnicola]